MALKVRFARWSDLDRFRVFVAEEFDDDPREIKRWLDGIEANLGLMFSLLCDDEVVGMAGLQWTSETSLVFHSDCVRKAQRGRGFGRLLFQARVASLDETLAPFSGGILALERNIPFYQRMGFGLIRPPAFDPMLRYSLAPMEMELDAEKIRGATLALATANVHLALDEAPGH